MKFSKAKMLARLEKEGLSDLLNDEWIKIMDNIDGKEVVKNDFRAVVYGVEEYYVVHKGRYHTVNKLDCE